MEQDLNQGPAADAAQPSGARGGEGAEAINLLQFCSDEEWRPYLRKPFRHDGYVYATNGHILVRVPDDDRYEAHGKINPAKAMVGFDAADFMPAPQVIIPPKIEPKRVECIDCAGRGKEHDCPDCDCTCETCSGNGFVIASPSRSTTIFGHHYNLEYIRQIYALPDLEIAPHSVSIGDIIAPLYFRFSGGCGALMPMRSPYREHVDIFPQQDRPIT